MPFFKNWKKVPQFSENTLIVVIYGLNLSFKMQFLSVSRKKIGDFPLRDFFSRFVNDCLSKCPDSKNTLQPYNMPGYAPELSYFEA